MTAADPRITPFGEDGWLIVLSDRISVTSNRRAHAIATAVEAELPVRDGWGRPTIGYASVLVPLDPDALRAEAARTRLRKLVRDVLARPLPAEDDRAIIDVPTRYGGDAGPDLEAVAERLGLAPEEVVRRHAAGIYRVFLLGFAPGFAYLGTLPRSLVLPRRETPRPRVPAGSVAIAGRQTAVYPSETPGGWHLLGRTSRVLWDPADATAGLAPGDRVRFVPVDRDGPPR